MSPWWCVPRGPRGSCDRVLLLERAHRIEERVVLSRGARGDPQPARYAVVADEYAAVEDGLPCPVTVIESPELYEVGVGLGDLIADRAQLLDQAVALGLELVDVLQQGIGV